MAKKKPRRKMSEAVFAISLAIAFVLDVALFWVPVLPGFIMGAIGFIFFLCGYFASFFKKRMVKKGVIVIVSWIIEFIPVLGSLWPGCMISITLVFLMNRSAIKAQKIEEILQQNKQIVFYIEKMRLLQRDYGS